MVNSADLKDAPMVRKIRGKILKDYKGSVFSPEPIRNPTKRGPTGEAEIRLKEGVTPVHKAPFHITGEMLDAMKEMVQALVD